MTTTTDTVTRYVVTHVNREGVRTLTGPAQGRLTYPSLIQAQDALDALNLQKNMIAQVYGEQAIGTFDVRACDCYPDHFDPISIWFGRVYHTDPGIRPTDENERLADERQTLFDERPGRRVGDYVRYPDGHEERISHDWGDQVQTSKGGSFFLGKGYARFSGGLNPGVPSDSLTLTDEHKPGTFWFFDRDWARAHSAVYVRIDCRVYVVA